MPAVCDLDLTALIDIGAAVTVIAGDGCKRAVAIELGDQLRILLKPVDTAEQRTAQLAEELVLKLHTSFLSADNALFKLLKLGSYVPFGVGKRLLALILQRHH